MELQKENLRCLEVVPPHEVISPLQLHVDAGWIGLLAFFHRLQALALRLAFLEQVSETHFCDTGVGLCDVPLNFRLRSSGLEWISNALLGGSDASFICLDGLDTLVDISEFHEAFVCAGGDLLDVALQDLLRLLLLLSDFEQVGITHHQQFVLRILVVGEFIEVFGLLVIERLVFLLSHLEERLEWQFLKGLHRHQQPII
jgi:hypothetical protein